MLGHLGWRGEARAALRRLSKEFPRRDPVTVWEILPFRNPAHAALMVEGMRKALAE
jgi:hypothetical protein